MSTTNSIPLTVSVIIPAYNRARFICAAIDSVLNQSRKPTEIIVVDDGSTDDTQKLLAAYGSSIRVISQKNQGVSVARNRGMREASGDAIVFLDSDDLLVPEMIERCVSVLESRPDVGVVYSDAYWTDENGNKGFRYSERMRTARPSGMVLADLACGVFVMMGASMIRRSALAGIEFEPGRRCGEDYDFWRRLAAAHQFQYVDEPLMCYRQHGEMVAGMHVAESMEAELSIQQRIMAMPEFAVLAGKQKARIFCFHGAKHAMLDRCQVARQFFWRAIRTAPTYPAGYVLAAASMCGKRMLQNVILARRRVMGNIMADRAEMV